MLKRTQVKDQLNPRRGIQRNIIQELNKQDLLKRESFDKLPIIGLTIPCF
jgi:hypothetical protein